MVDWTLRKAKRLIVAVAGFSVLAAGIAMILLPGPAIVVIPIGLGILAAEFVWARRLLKQATEKIADLRARLPDRMHRGCCGTETHYSTQE